MLWLRNTFVGPKSVWNQCDPCFQFLVSAKWRTVDLRISFWKKNTHEAMFSSHLYGVFLMWAARCIFAVKWFQQYTWLKVSLSFHKQPALSRVLACIFLRIRHWTEISDPLQNVVFLDRWEVTFSHGSQHKWELFIIQNFEKNVKIKKLNHLGHCVIGKFFELKNYSETVKTSFQNIFNRRIWVYKWYADMWLGQLSNRWWTPVITQTIQEWSGQYLYLQTIDGWSIHKL